MATFDSGNMACKLLSRNDGDASRGGGYGGFSSRAVLASGGTG